MTTPTVSVDESVRQRVQATAAAVRDASRAAKVVALPEVWDGTEEEFLHACSSSVAAGCGDLGFVRDSGRLYLFSESFMTRSYAESCAQTQCDDKRHVIAETVRAESRLYPRPTSIVTFTEAPFLLLPEIVDAAIAAFAGDPSFADIRQITASDGTAFVYSSQYLTPAHARSLAEWIAVERDRHW